MTPAQFQQGVAQQAAALTEACAQKYRREQYEDALKQFDWMHEFSDSNEVARRGREALKELHVMQAELDPTGELWLQHSGGRHGAPLPRVAEGGAA
jgi:hypothetical protein